MSLAPLHRDQKFIALHFQGGYRLDIENNQEQDDAYMCFLAQPAAANPQQRPPFPFVGQEETLVYCPFPKHWQATFDQITAKQHFVVNIPEHIGSQKIFVEIFNTPTDETVIQDFVDTGDKLEISDTITISSQHWQPINHFLLWLQEQPHVPLQHLHQLIRRQYQHNSMSPTETVAMQQLLFGRRNQPPLSSGAVNG